MDQNRLMTNLTRVLQPIPWWCSFWVYWHLNTEDLDILDYTLIKQRNFSAFQLFQRSITRCKRSNSWSKCISMGWFWQFICLTFETFPRTLHLQVFLESRDILNQLDRFFRELIWPGIKHSTLWETLLKTFDDLWCGIILQTKVYGCVWTAGGRGGASAAFIKSWSWIPWEIDK